jgi:hypothetical protein
MGRANARAVTPRTGEAARGPRPGPSVYENHRRATGPVVVLMTPHGRFVGVEAGGKFIEARPCCDDPADCDRPGCWTQIGVLR